MPSSSSESTLGEYRDEAVDFLKGLFNTSVKLQIISTIKDEGADWLDDKYFDAEGLHFTPSQRSDLEGYLGSKIADIVADGLSLRIDDALASSNPVWNTPISGPPTGASLDSGPNITFSFAGLTFNSGKSWSDNLRDELVGGAFSFINQSNNWLPTFTYTNGSFRLSLIDVSQEFAGVMSSSSASGSNATVVGAVARLSF